MFLEFVSSVSGISAQGRLLILNIQMMKTLMMSISYRDQGDICCYEENSDGHTHEEHEKDVEENDDRGVNFSGDKGDICGDEHSGERQKQSDDDDDDDDVVADKGLSIWYHYDQMLIKAADLGHVNCAKACQAAGADVNI